MLSQTVWTHFTDGTGSINNLCIGKQPGEEMTICLKYELGLNHDCLTEMILILLKIYIGHLFFGEGVGVNITSLIWLLVTKELFRTTVSIFRTIQSNILMNIHINLCDMHESNQ